MVRVIMAAYNAGPYINQAISSLLTQTFTDFELFIVDDASTDDTLIQIEAIVDERVHLIKLEKNAGVSAARNHALKECKAPYIAIMDADDISEPTRLEKQVQYMEAHPELVGLGSWVYLMAPNGKRVYLDKSPPTSTEQVMVDLFEFGGGGFPNTQLMRTEAIKKVGGYREVFPSSEDLDLLLRLTQFGKLSNLGEGLYSYRLNPNGITFSDRAKREHYAQQALGLWRERQTRGLDALDDGGTLKDAPISQSNSTNIPKESLNKSLSYFYRKGAQEKIISGEKWHGMLSLIYAIIHQPIERKNWVLVVKVILGKRVDE